MLKKLALLTTALALLAGCASASEIKPGIKAASNSTQPQHMYTIPKETARKIAEGEKLDLIPEELVVKTGETIEIINEDSIGHTMGVFYIGPKETLRQTFTSPGVLSGECSVNSSEQFSLIVKD